MAEVTKAEDTNVEETREWLASLEYILEQLKVKASIKQLVYRNLQEVFGQLREEGRRITEDLENRIQDIDTSVKVGYQENGDFEFSLHFADLLHENLVART